MNAIVLLMIVGALTSVTSSGVCKDIQNGLKCREGRDKGYCESKPDLALENCRKTCGLCAARYQCMFVSGNGRGGTEIKIDDKTGDDCIKACIDKKKNGESVNGVTVLSNNAAGCWCEKDMDAIATSSTHKTCYLTRTTEAFTPIDVAFKSFTVGRFSTPKTLTVEMKGRPTAYGEIDETTNNVQTGFVNFPDVRQTYKFWYYPSEDTIYWDNDKGKTTNIWRGKHDGGCPLKGFEYIFFGRNTVKQYTNIDSWEACSVLCWNNQRCHAWTYFTENHIAYRMRKDCDLKDSTYGPGDEISRGHGNVISGLRSCTGSYSSLGCWKDSNTRAIQTLEGTDGRLDGIYLSRKDAILKCYHVAKEKGFKYFAVQAGGWCASSATAGSRYRMYGVSTACRGGKGAGFANDVYIINDHYFYSD